MLIDDIRAESRVPQWAPGAAERGALSSLSVPVLLQREVRAAFNIYSAQGGGFDPANVELASTLAAEVGVVLANMHLYEAHCPVAEQLQQAMQSRAVIEQGKGMVLAVDAQLSLAAQVDALEALAVRALHGPVPAGDGERDEALRYDHRAAGTAGVFSWHATCALLREAEELLAGDDDIDVVVAGRLCELVTAAHEDLERPPFTAAPHDDEPGAAQPRPHPAAAPRPLRTPTVDVVVVEDDLILGALICRVVTDLGLTVAHCEDGVSALGLLAGDEPRARPRLILLAIDLPGRSGLSVLRVLQHDGVTASTAVTMMSCRSGAKDREQAAQLGATSFLSKPFTIRDVVARLRGLGEAVLAC